MTKPIPKDNEVLIKVHFTTVTASDVLMRGLHVPWIYKIIVQLMMGFGRPRNHILGMSMSGIVESIGEKVSKFNVGDAVVGYGAKGPTNLRFGTYAEYCCLPENWVLVTKPSGISFEDAAVLPYGGLLAWYYFKNVDLNSSSNVLIYGASGSIGTASLQLAKVQGATVTAVCSESNHKMVQALGADKVIDYTKDDSVSLLERYDLVFDAAGKSKSSLLKEESKKALMGDGKYVSIDDKTPAFTREDLSHLVKLAEEGKFNVFIDKTYRLEEMIKAHKYVERGHKKGNVLITIINE